MLVARSECMGFRARTRVGLQAFGGGTAIFLGRDDSGGEMSRHQSRALLSPVRPVALPNCLFGMLGDTDCDVPEFPATGEVSGDC